MMIELPTNINVEEWKSYIGKEIGLPRMGETVTAREIRHYCIAVDESNPIYYDEDLATIGKYGGIVAPHGYICWSTQNASTEKRVNELTEEGFDPKSFRDIPELPNIWCLAWVRGGFDWEFYKAVHVGDQITVRSMILDIYEKPGKSGALVFVVTEHSFTNQKGELVAVQRSTVVGSPRREEAK